MRTIYLNIAGPDGQNLPVGTPVALEFYSDAAPTPYRTGKVVEPGRLLVVLDGPDPVDGTGVNVHVLAVPGCAEWPGPNAVARGVLHGNEVVFDGGILGIQLKAGSNPFA